MNYKGESLVMFELVPGYDVAIGGQYFCSPAFNTIDGYYGSCPDQLET